MLLSPFSYLNKKVSVNGFDEDWLFFKDLSSDKPIETVAEIYTAIKKGKVISTPDTFALRAYDNRIQYNRHLKATSKKSRTECTNIDFFGNDDETVDNGISIDTVSYAQYSVSETYGTEYDSIFDNAEVISAVNSIKEVNEDFILIHSIDLIQLIKRAVEGKKNAMLKLRDICSTEPLVSELVYTLLSANRPIVELL